MLILFYKIKYNILIDFQYSFEKINYNQSIFKLGKVEDNKFYEWISYNKFKKTPEKIPKLEQIAVPLKLVNKYLCGNNKKITDEVESIKNNINKLFKFRSNNYLMTIINNKKILILKKDEIETFENDIIDYYFFSTLYYLQFNNKIKTIYPKQIFIPKYNPYNYPILHLYNNPILLHLSNNKYLYWSFNECYEFKSHDLITKFDVLLSINTYLSIYAIDKLNNYYFINSDNTSHKFIIMTKNNINMSPKKLDKLFELKKKNEDSVGIYQLKYKIPSWLIK